MISEVPEEFVANLVGNSVVASLAGRIPIETCGNVGKEDNTFETGHAHSVGFLGERLDHQFLILFSPFAHPHIQANDRADILDDVLRLPSFIVKRHSTSRQRFQNSTDVDFRATGHTYVKMWEGEFDKLLHEIENDFPWRGHSKSVLTFVKRVHNDVGWAVIGQCECLFEALYQDIIGGFVRAVVMSHVYAVEDIATKIRASRELGKKGKEQVSEILFLSIPEVEVIVSHGSESSITRSHDILDDRRASR